MKRQVWLNIETGEFSDSWDIKKDGDMNGSVCAESSVIKLIEYECKNDDAFEFINKMRIK